jgi:glycosyltransferase involved in cell wall biosynthesis
MTTELTGGIGYVPAASTVEVFVALTQVGPADIVHAHMTAAELAAVASRPSHRAAVVATRHFPHRRLQSPLARPVAAAIHAGLKEQVAISRFVAAGVGETSTVVFNGVPSRPLAALRAPRVLMLQRLEREKSPEVGIRAWARSGLGSTGWELAVAGTGRLYDAVRQVCYDLAVDGSVVFLGSVTDTDALLQECSILLAPAPAEPFGLAVVEAMSHGLPVIAACGGAHRETLGLDGCFFPPGDVDFAARQLTALAQSIDRRVEAGGRLRERQQRLFSVDVHVSRLERVFESTLRSR